MKTAKKISKKSKFSEIMKQNPEAATIFQEEGMHCFGCPMAMHETLEQGALAHGKNPDELIKRINKKRKRK